MAEGEGKPSFFEKKDQKTFFRLAALDGLRGCLAALVVADHAITELGSEALGIAADIAAAVFFVMSGLVLTRAWDRNSAVGVLAGRAPAPLDFIWIRWPRYDANILCSPMWSLFLEAWATIVWTWTDFAGHPRTVPVGREGSNKKGHGGYAIRSYTSPAPEPSPSTPFWLPTTNSAISSAGWASALVP